MNGLSLFSGIGGFDLGFERAGIRMVGQVELDQFCRTILRKHWPEVPQHDDVRTALDWWTSRQRPPVDVVLGGFPCQPASFAGLGLGTADPRWLWPAMHDVVVGLRPEWVVFENVPGLVRRGLDDVLADLADAGYKVAVKVISACAVGGPHMRKRLFGVAHTDRHGLAQRTQRDADTQAWFEASFGPDVVRRGQLVPGDWPAEPSVGRVAHGVPRRVDRVRALGNAVVPQVAEHIGRLIKSAHQAKGACA